MTFMLFEFLKNHKVVAQLKNTSPKIIDQLISEAGVFNTDSVIDLGSGVGVIALRLAGRKRFRGVVTALEINESFCNEIKSHGLKNLKVVCGDATKLKSIFKNKRFDSVITTLPITHFSDPIKVLHDIKSITKKGRRIAQLTFKPKKTYSLFKQAGLSDVKMKRVRLYYLWPGAIISGVN